MSIQNYSVLRGRAADVRQGSGKSPHFQILVIDQTNKYRIAINIQSSDNSEVFYVAKPGFRHPICDALLEQPIGLTAVASAPGAWRSISFVAISSSRARWCNCQYRRPGRTMT